MSDYTIRSKRVATSPTGPEGFGPCSWSARFMEKDPDEFCEHQWSDHDDLGCLFLHCDCHQPGERK